MKTKLFTLFLALVASVGTCHASTYVDGLWYNFNNNNLTAEVTYNYYQPYECKGKVIIPSEVRYNSRTYSVTSIGEDAFKGTGLTSVEISNGVAYIGGNAFFGCGSLTSVTIPNSITDLSWMDPFGNSPVSEIHYNGTIQEWCEKSWQPSRISTNYTLYIGDEKVTDLVLPDSVTNIGKSAFSGCTGLTSVTIGNSVTSIGDGIFSGCTGLTSVTISDSVTSIGESAFSGCTGLVSIVIPNSVTNIGVRAFSGCTGLTSIGIPNSVTSIGNDAFSGCTGLTSFEIPHSVTSIGGGAFYGCAGLISIEIPNSVTSIGNEAFAGCTGLTSIVWNARNSNGYNFGSQVTSFTFGDDIEVIPASICSEMINLTSVTIGNNVTSIGASAFSGCTGLTTIKIPNSVTSIGASAFAGCTGFTTIKIPNSVTSIGGSAFSGCTGLTSVTFSNNVTSIEDGVFSGCTGFASIVIPNSVTNIGRRAFSGCTGLTSVTIPNSVTNIGREAFSGCSGLTSIEIPHSVTSIGSYAFDGCSGLTSVTIPNSVTSIGYSAFSGCTGLTSIGISNSVTSIGNDAFSGCTGLTSIEIPHSVTSIGVRAFSGCTGLTSIEIPNSVTNIGDEAFRYCSSLTTIEIPNSVTNIGDEAFRYCSSLTSIKIPNSVTSLGNGTFGGCSALTSVIIGSSVTSIGRFFFVGCTALTSIIWNAKKYNDFTDNTATPFSNIKSQITSFVFGPDVEHIPAYICSGMTNIKTLTLPHVQTIGKLSFEDCSHIETIDFGTHLEFIGLSAFKGCTRVASMTCLADATPEVGVNALTNISNQAELYVLKNCVQKYKVDAKWNRFVIKEKAAENTDVTDVAVIPEENSAIIVWPSIVGAYTYEIVIKDKNDNVICTMVFNSNGQLTSIAFAPSRNGSPQHTQTAGFAFTVSGLEMGTEYNLTITAKSANGQALDKKNVTFRTNWPTAAEDLYVNSDKPVKVLMDGHIYILRGEKVYDMEGKMTK